SSLGVGGSSSGALLQSYLTPGSLAASSYPSPTAPLSLSSYSGNYNDSLASAVASLNSSALLGSSLDVPSFGESAMPAQVPPAMHIVNNQALHDRNGQKYYRTEFEDGHVSLSDTFAVEGHLDSAGIFRWPGEYSPQDAQKHAEQWVYTNY